MATLLLVIIFIAYIGLGIPDSLLGAAWPAIYPDFGVSVSDASYVTAIVSCGTIVSSFLSSRIIAKLGTARVTALSTALTAASLLGYSLSGSMLWMCLCAFPLGIGGGCVDTALNNYVAIHYNATHMNFLHCFYGVGVSLSPYLMSLALSENNNWRAGFRIMFLIQAALAVMMFCSLPIWKKVGEQKHDGEAEGKVLGIKEVLKIPAARATVGVLIGSCATESACLVWGSTFLVEAKNATPDKAAELITLYFIGMTLGRFVSGLLVNKLSCTKIIVIGEIITIAAAIGTAVSPSALAAGIAMLFIGFGNGPLFPNITHLVPLCFGKEASQSIIGVQMGFSYVSILLTPFIFGFITEHMGAQVFPAFVICTFVVTAVSTAAMLKTLGKNRTVQ